MPTRPVPVGHPYGRRVLADELARLRQAPPRTRNRTLNACAFKVYRYVGGGVLDAEQVTAAFYHAALAIGLDPAEVERRIAYRKLGRYIRFHPDDVEEYIAANRVEADGAPAHRPVVAVRPRR